MKRVKILKVCIIFFTALVLVVVLSAALFITFYPKEKFLKIITTNAEIVLGKKVSVKDINYSLGGVSLERVVVFEGISDASPELASAENVELTFSLVSLLKRNIDVDAITVKNARFTISFNDLQKSNIQELASTFSKKTGDSGITAKISKIILSNAVITLSTGNVPQILSPLTGTYSINAIIKLGRTVTIHNCKIKLPQSRGTIYPELTIKTKKGDFEISGDVNLENASLLWVYQWSTNQTIPYNVINGKVTNLIITKNYVKGNANASSTLRNTNKVLRAIGFCNVDIAGRSIFIGQTKGAIDNSSFFADTIHFSFDGNLIRFNVKNVDASISDITPILKYIPVKLFGRVRGDLQWSNGLYNGSISIADGGYDQDVNIVSNLNASIVIKNNQFKKADIPFRFYGNSCTLSIACTDSSMKKIFINMNADKILIDSLKNKFSQNNAPFFIPIEIGGIINVNLATYNQYTFSNIQLHYLLAGTTFQIKGFQFNFAEGTIMGKGSVNLPQGAPQASLLINFKNVMAQNVIFSNEKIRNRFFGLISGNSKVDFDISSNILRTARGNVEFNVDKGKLVDTGIQKGLGLLLSELRFKLKDLEFNKIYGNIDIAGTNYSIKQFIFNSNSIRLKITGSFNQNFIASPLNINLEFTREFIQDLPAINFTFNKYLKGDWYIIQFMMNGDMTESKNVKKVN